MGLENGNNPRQPPAVNIEALNLMALDVADVKVDTLGGFVYFTATRAGSIDLATPTVVRLPYDQFLALTAAAVTNVINQTRAQAAAAARAGLARG